MIPSSEELREVAGLREGSLRATPFSVLLLALSARHRSLALEMRRKQINKRIVLEHGTPVDCRSNLVHETLGRYMVSLGKLTPEDLHTYLGQSASAGQPLGEVLLEHDVVTAEELFKLLQQNLAKKLLDIFTWRDGEFRIHEDSGAVESPLKIRVPQLVITGITKFAPQEEVDAGVVPLVGKKLVLHPTPPFALDEVRLTQRQTQVAVALRSGGWRIDELALGTAMPFEEITRLLYALALLGVVVTAEHPAAKAASRTSRTAVLPLPATDAAAASPLGTAADAAAASPPGADAAPPPPAVGQEGEQGAPGAAATPVSAGAGAGPAAVDIADLSLAPPAADNGASSTAASPSTPAAAAAAAIAGAPPPATTQPPSRATRPAARRSGDETTPPTGSRTVGPRDTRAAATRPMPIMPLGAATLDASAANLDAPAASATAQDPAATGDRTVATDHAAPADAAASAPAARAADRAPGTGGTSPAPTAPAAIASPNAGGAPTPATSPAPPPATAPPPDLAAIVASLSTAGGTVAASVPALTPPPPPPPPAPNRNEIMQIYLSYRRLDAFDLLGVDEDASPAAVEAKYLEAARRFAPWDLTGPAADLEEKARDIFLATSRAYAELLDLEQRNALLFRRQAKRDERGRRSPDMAIKTDLLDPEVQYRKGRAFMDAGKFQEAAVLLEFASDCDPQNGLYSAELAYCRFCLAPSHGARAIKELEETLRRDADCGLAVYYTGEIHRQLGNRDEAEKNLRRAIKMMSPDRRPIEALKLLSAEKRR